MNISLKDPLTALDEKIVSFTAFNIDETDYYEYFNTSKSGFLITNKWILHLEKKKTSYFIQPVCTYVKIKYRQQDIITKKISYCVEIYNENNCIDVTMDSNILTSQGCRELLKYGCVYDENNVRSLLKYLSMSAISAPTKNVHTRLGWIWDYEQPVFLANKAISQIDFESDYTGNLELAPKGTMKAFLKMIQNEVISKNNTALLFGMLVGFASPILGYLNHFLDLGCMVFSYSNLSSKGKTTLALLAASIFSNAASERGCFTTMDSTQKALISFVAQANSCTVSLDEAGTADKKNIRQTLYQMASGRDRMRLDTDGNIKEHHTFNSCILCTAEFPIIDDTAPNGIRARVYEVHDNLTTSAENADSIKKCVYKNYGHIGNKFVRFIVRNKLDCILDDYYAAKDELLKLYEEKDYIYGELTERILSKLAVILVTAYYVNQCFSLHIPIQDIVEYILQLERSITTEADIATKALDCISQYVTRHNNKFLYDDEEYFNSALDGTVKDKRQYKEIRILKTVVEQILADNGFENPKDVYNKWAEMKILSSEKDRPYKRIKLVNELPTLPCFIFKITA